MSKPVDLRTCKPGDKLLSKHGLILTYVGPNPHSTAYPHMVRYPKTDELREGWGSRTDDGFVMSNVSSRLSEDHDIVKILPSKPAPKKAAWKFKYDNEIVTMDNAKLLEETLGAATPDDYDGCFTKQGEYRRDASQNELKRRLSTIGFLKP